MPKPPHTPAPAPAPAPPHHPPGGALHRTAAVFLPAAVPRQGRFAFWSPDGEPLPASPEGAEQLTVVRPHGAAGIRSREVPAVVLSVTEALPLLVRAAADPAAHPATRCWGTAARQALGLVARGRLLPGLTPEGYDAWRAGPLDAEDIAQLRAVAAALPHEGYATPLAGRRPLHLPEPEALLRAFLDAVADTLPRTPAAPFAAGRPFAAAEPQRVPGMQDWAAQVAAGSDAGVGLSLRLDLSSYRLFDQAEPEEVRRAGAAVVQLHSLADPTLVTDAAQLWAGTAAAGFGPRARVDAVLALRRAGRVWPPLLRLLDQPVPDALALSDPELEDLLGRAATRLAAAGVLVHWPRELARSLTATAVVRSNAPGSATDGTAFFDAAGLFSFSWELALGGDRLTPGEMDALAQAHRPVVRLRDQWVRVDPELVRKARKRELGLLDPVDALAVVLGGTAEVDGEPVPAVPVGALAALRDRLTGDLEALPAPAGLKATLREYQARGLAWLDRMTSLGLGGCLADDMGLGKTVTLIALHLHRARPEPTLVVCPASLLGNWQREIERFAPGVPVRRYHGATRTLEGLTGDGLNSTGAGFVLTTYGTMRAGAARLAEQSWGMVVADEAQHVKNPHSATARALRTIPAPARVALTGTPVENNLSELWALLDWTTPGLLGPLTAFRARHARAVEQQQQEDGGNDEAVARLAALVRPFLLRRKKSDPGIAPELPPKTETDHPVSLTREQASLYQAAVDEAMAVIEASEGIERRGMIMKLLASLKQICNHPAQYLKEEHPRIAHRSGKLALLDELLDTILAEGGSVLVFTQYVTMARILEKHLAARGIGTQLLHGGTPVPRREELVDRFQSGEVPVFLLSLKAAGTGLNLTRAAHVVHYDRWWNPAVEEQATDRAYRIGQTQPVQVHRIIAEGTVEDRIAEMLDMKRALADAVLGSGETALTELTDRELADLVSLRRPA
ncbi:DEAD/DEAH box helicase [Streptomyces sp. NPDC002054]|uniref:DEAD/DEAH box helicase n=1 Tax=Streptomyces sp. NPDC002054 TaxID=3154663 RepID=UPI00331AF826